MKKILCVFLFQFFISKGFSTTYFLSANGSDSNSGTSSLSPWQTIDKLNSVFLQPGDSIFFECGSIFRGEIIVTSGGTDAEKIYFGKYGTGNLPVISGAKVVSGWSNYVGNIYVAQLAQTPAHLFADDKQMTIARYPNNGFLKNQFGIGNTGFVDSSLTQPNGYWTNARAIMRTHERAWEARTVDSFSNNTIVLQFPTGNGIGDGYGYYFDNLFSVLDTANEWYYDSNSLQLYFIAPGNIDPSSLNTEASDYDYGIDIKNGSSYIVVENIQFEKQRKTGLFVEAYSTNIGITSSVFRLQEESSIRIPNGGTNCSITKNSISDVNGIGISLSHAHNSIIQENALKRIGLVTSYRFLSGVNYMTAIECDNCDSVIIDQNTIDSVGGVGISAGVHHSVVSKNLLNHSLLNLNFLGGIYTNGLNSNASLFDHNIILNTIGNIITLPFVPLNAAGMYVDESADSNTFANNTVVYATAGIMIDKNSSENILRHNVVYGCTESQLKISEGYQGGTTNNVVAGNTFYSLSESSDVVELTSPFPFFNPAQFDSNYYFNPYAYHVFRTMPTAYGFDHSLYYTLEQWQERMNQDMNSYGSFFYRSRFSVVDTMGNNLIGNSFFTNNFDGWINFHPDTMAMFLDNSTPLDFGCLKSNFLVSLPNEIYGPSYASFQFDSGALYQLHLSTYSIKTGNVIVESKEFAGSGGVFATTPRAFPFQESRNDYNAVIQARSNCELCYLTLDLSGQDSIMWVDNITLYPISGLYEEPEKKSRLFINPFSNDLTFDLGDSIFFNLDQVPIANSFTLGPYSSTVLIFDSSMILSVHENVTPALLKIFPNPVLRGNTISLLISQVSDDCEITICDLQGKRSFNKMVFAPQKNFQIKIPSLISQGTYFISVKNKYGVWSGKVVVQ